MQEVHSTITTELKLGDYLSAPSIREVFVTNHFAERWEERNPGSWERFKYHVDNHGLFFMCRAEAHLNGKDSFHFLYYTENKKWFVVIIGQDGGVKTVLTEEIYATQKHAVNLSENKVKATEQLIRNGLIASSKNPRIKFTLVYPEGHVERRTEAWVQLSEVDDLFSLQYGTQEALTGTKSITQYVRSWVDKIRQDKSNRGRPHELFAVVVWAKSASESMDVSDYYRGLGILDEAHVAPKEISAEFAYSEDSSENQRIRERVIQEISSRQGPMNNYEKRTVTHLRKTWKHPNGLGKAYIQRLFNEFYNGELFVLKSDHPTTSASLSRQCPLSFLRIFPAAGPYLPYRVKSIIKSKYFSYNSLASLTEHELLRLAIGSKESNELLNMVALKALYEFAKQKGMMT